MRDELSWTHYRLLLKVEKAEARQFYIEETIAGNWNTRTLERQINSLYYERLLMSGKEDRPAVQEEATGKAEAFCGKPLTPTLLIGNPTASYY